MKTIIVFISLVLVASLHAKEFKELENARREYEQAVPSGNEVARLRYVNKLAKMLDRFVGDYRKNGSHKNDDTVKALHAELKRCPAPKDSDSQKFSRLLIGKWQSPRHEYLFREDGTWSMLPLEEESTTGRWRIEGNQYIDTSATEPATKSRYTIILLNKDYFIFSDKNDVFFESRMSE